MREIKQKLEILLDDLRINQKAEKEEKKSYFNTQLMAIRVKEILDLLEKEGK